MLCNNCGKEIDDQAALCPHCGTSIKKLNPGELDGPIGGLGILCFLFPLVGLIMYLSWKSGKPIKAKGAGKWTLWGIGISVVITVIILLSIGAAGAAAYGY